MFKLLRSGVVLAFFLSAAACAQDSTNNGGGNSSKAMSEPPRRSLNELGGGEKDAGRPVSVDETAVSPVKVKVTKPSADVERCVDAKIAASQPSVPSADDLQRWVTECGN
jgi:hypothetical protein